MKFVAVVVLTFVQLCVIAQNEASKKIKIQWVDHLPGDFSFAKKWSYPEGVYKNEFGQLSCDGICPEEIYAMKDSTGKIYEDSLTAFYKLVDTAHQYHSIKADAWCYEYAGTNYIKCKPKTCDNNLYQCYTLQNAATHCSLNFSLDKNYCKPYIYWLGVSSAGADYIIFPCTGGTIKIDKKSWEKGILKAIFDFKFKDTYDSKKFFWRGKIFTPMLTCDGK